MQAHNSKISLSNMEYVARLNAHASIIQVHIYLTDSLPPLPSPPVLFLPFLIHSIVSVRSQLFGSVNTGINFDNYDSIPVETSGENCPQPMTNFDECNFAGILQENIKVLYSVHV